jgi:peroxiredoxin
MSSSKSNLATMVEAGSGIGHNRILPSGSTAPDFSLLVTPNQTLSLRELLGRPVILAFYPADWSPVCGDQMALYNEILPEFTTCNATLLGISVDGVCVMPRLPQLGICIFRWLQISNLKDA